MVQNQTFECTSAELYMPVEYRGAEGHQKIIDDYGSVEELCLRLKTNSAQGISSNPEEIERRTKVFRSNKIHPPPLKPFGLSVWHALKDTIRFLLWAIVSLVISAIVSFCLLFVDNTSGVLFSFLCWLSIANMVYQTNIDKLVLIRDGRTVEIGVGDLLVGDICCLKDGKLRLFSELKFNNNISDIGDELPADGIVVESRGLGEVTLCLFVLISRLTNTEV